MNKTPNKNYNNETSPIPAVKHRQLTNSYQRLETSIGKSGDIVWEHVQKAVYFEHGEFASSEVGGGGNGPQIAKCILNKLEMLGKLSQTYNQSAEAGLGG